MFCLPLIPVYFPFVSVQWKVNLPIYFNNVISCVCRLLFSAQKSAALILASVLDYILTQSPSAISQTVISCFLVSGEKTRRGTLPDSSNLLTIRGRQKKFGWEQKLLGNLQLSSAPFSDPAGNCQVGEAPSDKRDFQLAQISFRRG